MINKIGFIITAFTDTNEKEKCLLKLVQSVRNIPNIFLVVSSHTPINIDVQEIADYCIYDKNNQVDDRAYSHGCAESMLIEQAMKVLKYYNIKHTFKIPFDVEINDISVFDNWKKDNKYKIVTSVWGNIDFSSFAFYTDVDWFMDTFSFYHNVDSMMKRSNILEEIWRDDIISKTMYNKVYLFKDFREYMFQIYKTNNKVDLYFKDYNKRKSIKHFYQNVDGMFDFEDIYNNMVLNAKDNYHFVEVGAWRGKSSSYMATEINNSGKNIKFDVIDTWEGSKGDRDEKMHNDIIDKLDTTLYEDFLINTKPVSHIINPIIGLSTDIANQYKDNSLDFVFIDAAHDYDNIKADIMAWFPKVKIGGYIGGHDYTDFWHGVVQATNEFFTDIYNSKSSWLCKKENNELIKKESILDIRYNNYENKIYIRNNKNNDNELYNIHFKTLDNYEICNKINNFKFEKDINYWFSLISNNIFKHDEIVDLIVDIYDKDYNLLNSKKIIKNLNSYITSDKQYFISYTDENFLQVSEYLVKSLNEFSDKKIILYGINCDIKYDYPNLIKKRIDYNLSEIPHIAFIKPYVVLQSIKDGIEEGIFIDADNIANKNIDDLWNNFKFLDNNYPLFNKSHWDFSILNKKNNPNDTLLKKYSVESKQILPYVQTNLFLFSKSNLDVLSEWNDMCLDIDNYSILKEDPYIVDESLLNILLRKKGYYHCLDISTINSYCLDDYKFAMEKYEYYKYIKNPELFNGTIDNENLNYYPEKNEMTEKYTVIPLNKNTIKSFHGCKNTIEQEKIFNYLINNNTDNTDIIVDDFSYILNQEYNKILNSPKNLIYKNKVEISYHDGALVNITGNKEKMYNISFIDGDTNKNIYSLNAVQNSWASPLAKYYINWKIVIDGVEYNLDLKNKNVLIHIDSNALGDTIAWMPYAEEFRKKHNCLLTLSTFHNYLFESEYPHIKFVDPKTRNIESYAYYIIGVSENVNRNKESWREIPLQKISSNILGLEFKEIKPKITNYINNENIVIGKYVCIGTSSTMKCKLWNKNNGWQETIDYLNNNGYKVVDIGDTKHNNLVNMDFKNVIDYRDKTLKEIIPILNKCEFFIGLGSGLSWLAWALNKKVIMVSGFSQPWTEFTNPYRIFTDSKCNGCFNDKKYEFGRNWDWCPKNKKFACTTQIQTQTVIKTIDKLISDNSVIN